MDIVAELKARAQSAFLEKSYEACISITSEAIGRLSQLASLSGGPEPRAELSRELSRLHSNRAAARLELGDFIAAADDAQQAVAFDGSWHRPYMRLCLALSFLNRRDDAAEALQRGLLACSGNADQLIDLQAALKDLQMQQRVVRRRQDAPEREGGRRAGERQHNRNLPVIALCGFLGAGKTTLVRHLLSSLQAQAEGPALPQHHQQHLGDLPQVPPPRGQMAAFAPQEMHAGQAASCTFHGPRQLRIGLIVNDLAPLNVDAQLLALPLQHPQPVTHPQPPAGTAAAAGRPAEADPSVGTAGVPAAAPSPHLGDPAAGAAATLVELSNGCVCCNLKGDLQQALRSMADFRAGGGHGGKGGEGSSIEVRGAGAAGAGDGTCMGQADGTSADGKGAVDGGSGSGSRRGARGGGSGGQNAAAGGISSSSRGTHGSDSGRKEGMLDLVVVESTGVGEPEALAAAVAALEPYGVVLHSVVTVVDAGSFLSYMLPYGTEQPAGNGSGGGGAGLADGRAGWMGSGGAAGTGGGVEGGVGGDGRKPLASLLAQQVECADVVLVNKCDLLLQQCVEEEHQREQEAAVALGAAKEEGMGTDPQARVGEGRSGGSRSATGSAAAAAEREARRRLGRVVAAVRALNRTARVVTCCECRVGPEVVLCGVGEGLGEGGGAAGAGPRVRRIAGATEQAGGTVDDGSDGMVLEQGGVFRGAQLPGPLAAGKGAAWGSAGGEDRAHEEEEYGIGSVVFKDRRPFHPGRLWAMVQALVEQQGERGREEGQAPSGRVQRTAEGSTAGAASGGGGPSTEGAGPLPAVPAQLLPMPRLLRAKGLFWVASLPQAVWELSLAGGEVELRPVGRWLASMVPPELWPRQQPGGQVAQGGDAEQGGQDKDREPVGQGEQGLREDQQHDGRPDGRQQGMKCSNVLVERQEGADCVKGAAGPESGAGAGSQSTAGWWHPLWGDRECGLVFIGVGLREGEGDGGGEGAVELGSHVVEAGVEGRGAQRGLTVEVAQEGGSNKAAGVHGELGAGLRLRRLMEWALVTGEEEALGEEAWEAWDDSMWLDLMERL